MKLIAAALALALGAVPVLADDVLLGTPGTPADDGLTPLQIGQIFCLSVLGNDLAPVLAIATPKLAEVLENNDDGRRRLASYNDPSTCHVGAIDTGSRGRATVEIDYNDPKRPDQGWTDSIVLQLERGAYSIADVMLGDDSVLEISSR